MLRKLLATPAPRWLVLLVDMAIVALSCLLTFTYSFWPEVGSEPEWLFTVAGRTVVVVMVYTLCSLALRSYGFIIRLSAIFDMCRVALMVATASVLCYVVSWGVTFTYGVLYIRLWNLFLIAMFSFSMMMVERLALKYIYAVMVSRDMGRERVIMLGSAINSFLIASALKTEEGGRFNPVALLSVSGKTDRHMIDGIPVVPYDPATVEDVFKRFNCSTLIFLTTQYEFVRSELTDVMLSLGVKLLMLNQVEEFDGQNMKNPSLSTHVKTINIEDLLGREQISTGNPVIAHNIAGQVVMITGAAGSIGSEIVRQVASFGAKQIVLFDQAESPMHDMQLEMEEHFPDTHIQLMIGDIANKVRLEEAFRKFKPRYVFHAAAYKHVPMMECNPIEAVANNVMGTKNVADLSLKYNVDKFVMVSTDKAVNPTNIMGASKRIAEIYVQSLFFNVRKNSDGRYTRFITTRFGNVLGSNGSVIPLFRRQIENGGPVTVTHRDIIRYFMTIPEACSLVLEAGCMGHGGEIYIFDMGKPVKIYDLATRMISLAGLRPGVDIQIVETGLRPGEKLYEELLNDKETTIATHHPKIMIAKVRVYDYADVKEHIEKLAKAIAESDCKEVVREMKHMVPEFKSRNSQWEAIDREINNQSDHQSDLKTL